MTNELFYQILNDDELLRISKKIKEKKKITSGEIVVSIKERSSLSFKKKTVRELAELEYNRIGINKTRDNTGILLYFLLERREFYILADSAINEKVSDDLWDSVKGRMETFFKNGEFCKGIISAVDEVGDILAKHFPIKPDDTNEISNKVIVRP
ncbi:MAG: TPM domain-containing protein [Ignavibacteria bacterium]|nr:TPM domain-containing protein [Ignavibacteria bacterium]